MFRTAAFLFATASLAFAADPVPKEMKGQLIKNGTVLLQDKFDAPELDKKWRVPQGENAGKNTIENGAVVIDSGAGRQGAIWAPLQPNATDVGVQLLMKPYAVRWMGVRFMTEETPGKRQWQIATVIYETGQVRVVVPQGEGEDENKLKVIKAGKTKLKSDDWWRVAIESKGDNYLVRVNGEEVCEVKAKETEGTKRGVMINLYGGKGAADEVVVTASATK